MPTSIATVSISGTLESRLRAVADAGFDGVEIFENDLLSIPGTAREVGNVIRDLGMRCTVFQPFRGEAEYFRCYSRAFGKRVFFEIVERRGYAGYGAVNAVIRLAAQARFKPDAAI